MSWKLNPQKLGSAYFMIWTALNALHIVGTYVEVIQYITTFTEAATSILVARFILNLREVVSAPVPRDSAPDEDAYWNLMRSWHVASCSNPERSDKSWDVKSFLAPIGAPLDHASGPYEEGSSRQGAASVPSTQSTDQDNRSRESRGDLKGGDCCMSLDELVGSA
ncbi:hypothetical protein OH77DRAFT_60059 [Trametes cingulata]|nr:hypothetical protein OH77DRAFT_60059 [Trametes cingulata]